MTKLSRKLILSLFPLILLLSCSSQGIKIKDQVEQYEDTYETDVSDLDISYAKDLVISGSIFEQQRSYANAILEYLEALKYDSSASIMWAIAKCYNYLGRREMALDWALKSYYKDSNFTPVIKLLADLYFVQYDIPKALKYYEILVNKKPSLTNKLRLAVIYEFDQPLKAIEVYENIIEDGEDLSILQRLAELYRRTSNKEKYLNTAEKLYEYSSYNDMHAIDFLDALLKYKEFSKADSLIDNLELTMSSDRYNYLLQLLANKIILDTGNYSKEFINKFLKKIDNKRRFEWRLQLIAAYLASYVGDSVKVESLIAQVLKIADTSKDIPIEVSFLYSYSKRDEKAIEILSNYEKKYPNDYRYPYFISIAYSNLKKYDSALNALMRSLNINDSSLDIWTQIGIVYDQLGLIDSSDFAYQKALAINPFDPLVNNNYAYSLSVRGVELEKALEMIKISLEREPENPYYLDTYGWIQFKMNNFDEALKYIDKSLFYGGKSAEVWEHKGDILEKMGNINEAINAWQKAIEFEPDRISTLERLKKYNK